MRFDPAVGAEIRKNRPAVVMNPRGVGRLPLSLAVPVTDWRTEFATFPWFAFIAASSRNGLVKNSGADAFQVKSVSHNRFVRKLGEIDDDQLDEIAEAIAACVGFRPPS